MKIAIIGGGAAGFFAALSARHHHAKAEITIFEKSSKLLAKVKVSGGGRCNLTNGSENVKSLIAGYPRGQKVLRNLLRKFSNKDVMTWFESRGVAVKVEPDGRVFPMTDNSQTIINCLVSECEVAGVEIKTNTSIDQISHDENGIRLNEKVFEKVIIASGGSPRQSGLQWLVKLGHEVVTPVPSLFTFNMPNEEITKLMGVVAPNALVSIQGSKLTASGPILITHWGMSGPAILKLSSFGARDLAGLKYKFKAQVNWSGLQNQEDVRATIQAIADKKHGKQLDNIRPFDLPDRLWRLLLKKSDLHANKRWIDLGKKGLNKLTEVLSNDVYQVSGKTTFKEEFVTCGGISLNSINPKTMESKVVPGLYFAGEVLDIDGITGGYNFQAAWTTGFIAGQLS